MMLHTKYQIYRHCGFWQDAIKRFPYITLYKTDEPPSWASFEPRGIILIISVKTTRCCYIPNIKTIGFAVFDKIFFYDFPI